MLKFLNIKNFVIIPQLEIEFHEGLNLLTGETGAGKSIIVDALGLLLGARGSAELVRAGERAAVLEGAFELGGAGGHKALALLESVGVSAEAGEYLTIRRELQTNGRNRIFVNDRSVTVATLKTLQPLLVETHGQGEQQALVSARAQLRLLDRFGGCDDLRTAVGKAYTRWRSAVASLQAQTRDEAERERALDLLRFQLTELERVNPQVGEEEALAAEKGLLIAAERVQELQANAYAELYDSDASILTRLAAVRRWLQDLQAIDQRISGALEAVEHATISLTDVADALRLYGAAQDFSLERLAEVESRLIELERLRRKYGRGGRSLGDVRAELQSRLGELEHWVERERVLQAQSAEAEQVYVRAARELTACRRAAAPVLEQRVMAELGQVALGRVHFVVRLDTAPPVHDLRLAPELGVVDSEADGPGTHFWTATGADRVEFLLSANVGEEVRPLGRIASGGELSRLMLTLRTVVQSEASGPDSGTTLVFDEIDVGIGGRVAETVGRRLKTLAGARQVLCVTHQAQLARFADHHYSVRKTETQGRTVTSVTELGPDERIGELARMIGGAEDVATARAAARWLLENATVAPPETELVDAGAGGRARARKRQRR